MRPPRRCNIDGEGMVIFGVAFATDARNSKSPTMIGFEHLDLADHRGDRWLVRGPAELQPRIRVNRDAVELRQEIEMPPVAAELAVGDRPQAERFLACDSVADRAFLELPQALPGEVPRPPLAAGARKLHRAQKAADVVGAVGRSQLSVPCAVRSRSASFFSRRRISTPALSVGMLTSADRQRQTAPASR